MRTFLLGVVFIVVLAVSPPCSSLVVVTPPPTTDERHTPSDEKVAVPKADLLKLLLQRQQALDAAQRFYNQRQLLQEENRQLRLMLEKMSMEEPKCKSM